MRIAIAGLFLTVILACGVTSCFFPPYVASDSPYSENPTLRETLGYTIRQEKESLHKPQFSPSTHFFTGPIEVKIFSSHPDALIYYTTDGSQPTRNSTPYDGFLALPFVKGDSCVVVKAVAIIDGEESSVSTHSYFFDPEIPSRYSSYVFSLSTDREHLYGYTRGILIPGKQRDDSRLLYPGKDENALGANYKERGRAWERPVDVEVFSPDGSRLLSQKAGLRVFGGVSRHFSQKSLRLTARKAYEPNSGKFKYPFFPELASDMAKFPVLSYDSLTLSNGGQDLEDAQLRTPLATRIAALAEYHWVAPVHSAAVYLNGGYYGHAFLTSRFDDSMLAAYFDKPADDFIVLNGGVKMLRSSPKHPELMNWRMLRSFKMLMEKCESRPMDAALYQEILQQIDVENLLFYYAIQSYLDNRDWPDDHNNTKVWRYSGREGASIPELDGRWRYVLYDLDATALSPWHGAKPPSNPTLPRVREKSPLFSALLKRPELASQFANNMCDMAFAHYSESHVRHVMRELDAVSLTEIRRAAADGVYSPPGLMQTIEKGRETIMVFFRERPQHVLDELRAHFGYTDLYHVAVEGQARLNTIGPDNPEGWYFVENPVSVAPALPPGKVVARWEVNGQPRSGDKLVLSANDAINGEVRVRLVTEDEPVPLVLEAAYDHGDVCGFSLRNTSATPVTTQGLYLSDKLGKPRKHPLQGMVFGPGEVRSFVGKGAQHISALDKIQVNFKPQQGETVYLRNQEGQILSSVVVR